MFYSGAVLVVIAACLLVFVQDEKPIRREDIAARVVDEDDQFMRNSEVSDSQLRQADQTDSDFTRI